VLLTSGVYIFDGGVARMVGLMWGRLADVGKPIVIENACLL